MRRWCLLPSYTEHRPVKHAALVEADKDSFSGCFDLPGGLTPFCGTPCQKLLWLSLPAALYVDPAFNANVLVFYRTVGEYRELGRISWSIQLAKKNEEAVWKSGFFSKGAIRATGMSASYVGNTALWRWWGFSGEKEHQKPGELIYHHFRSWEYPGAVAWKILADWTVCRSEWRRENRNVVTISRRPSAAQLIADLIPRVWVKGEPGCSRFWMHPDMLLFTLAMQIATDNANELIRNWQSSMEARQPFTNGLLVMCKPGRWRVSLNFPTGTRLPGCSMEESDNQSSSMYKCIFCGK